MSVELFRQALRDAGFQTSVLTCSAEQAAVCAHAPVWYSPEMLAYQAIVLGGDTSPSQDVVPLCLALKAHGKAVALFSAIIDSRNSITTLRAHTEDMLCPLVTAQDRALRRRVVEVVVKAVRASFHLPQRWHVVCYPSLGATADLDFYLAELSCESELFFDGLVDTTLDDATYFRLARYSLKAQIAKAKTIWAARAFDSCSPDLEQAFWVMRELHAIVAGRITRAMESWSAQASNAKAGQGLLVLLMKAEGIELDVDNVVGAAYFDIGHNEMAYSSAAYRRELFGQPIGHLAQHVAIEYARKRGIGHYRVGTIVLKSTHPRASDKELKIAQFKAGICTHLLPGRRFLMH
jgi:FemAB family protein